MNFRHRQSPSSDRFLSVFSPPENSVINSPENELNEDDIFWTGQDFSEPNRSTSPSKTDQQPKPVFKQNSGILAALPETSLRNSILYRKPSLPISNSSSGRNISLIPKIPLSNETVKMNHSAPVNVPVLTKAMERNYLRKKKQFFEADEEDGVNEGVEEDGMLPPHEIVARGSALTPNTTFSVLEGVGRTLKGRDLRQVRNAVWRQTGFLD